MLTHLSIRNIVLAKKADIAFSGGLCVLTGETGAGKSILLDALGLALGARAEARLVRAGEAEANVTACFDTPELPLLEELGIEMEGELIIRRSLSAEGKSKCFINDQPVSAKALKQLGEQLVEVHGQHDQRGLMEPRQHGELIDQYGELDKPRANVARAYADWRAREDELQALQKAMEEAARERDYLQHLAEELSALAPEQGEEQQLAEQRMMMMQGEKLAGTLNEALSGLQEEARLRDVQRLLMRAQPKDSEVFEPVIDALERAQLEAQQAEDALEQLLEASAYDPAELERIEERLFAIRAAARKYQCEPDALSEVCAKAKATLGTLEDQGAKCAALREAIAEAKEAYQVAAGVLSDARKKAATKLEKALAAELKPLKMGKCRFQVVIDPLEEAQWSARGVDSIHFEASTNPGQPFAPLQAIASGGELSRFMLALKVVLSNTKSTPTMIFDEIDTGTGGAVAAAIGARLAALAARAQVLVVTHLPQVAARGNQHLRIEKSEKGGQTETRILPLDEVARTEELARMLAGESITDEARGAAEKLLEATG